MEKIYWCASARSVDCLTKLIISKYNIKLWDNYLMAFFSYINQWRYKFYFHIPKGALYITFLCQYLITHTMYITIMTSWEKENESCENTEKLSSIYEAGIGE